jgi:DNA-binding Xre family transcriptional regulator
MLRVHRPSQTLSVIVRGRKLKGIEPGRFITIDQTLCKKLGIYPGDILEIQIKRIVKAYAEQDEEEKKLP